jgi:hypothetical protein
MLSGIIYGLCTICPTVSGKQVIGSGFDGWQQRLRYDKDEFMGELSNTSSVRGSDNDEGGFI